MSVRNVLVAYDGGDAARRALALSSVVALRHDAHVSGLCVQPFRRTHAPVDGFLTASVLDALSAAQAEQLSGAKAAFEAQVAAEGLPRASFHAANGYPEDVLAQWARFYDLLVLPMPEEDDHLMSIAARPDRVAFQSGRPVLIAPRSFDPRQMRRGAVVAWDGGRAAARALSDGMTLLEDEEQVTVLHVGEAKNVRQDGRDVMEHLSRHNVKATLSLVNPGKVAISDILLNACSDKGAGLLVMGAYEHSPLAESVFGGVTHDVVRRSHVPILMSH